MSSEQRQWTVGEALRWMAGFLGGKDDQHPRRSAEWILSAATGLTRTEIYAYHDRPLTPAERTEVREALKGRANGLPLQYLTGEMPFRRIVLKVERGVFIPRPETEFLVEEGLEFLAKAGVADPVVVDLCTGSGCVACSVAREHPRARVWAVDVSQDAVRVATANAQRLGVGDRVTVLLGDLTGPLPPGLKGQVDLILANPPYVPTADMAALPPEVLDFEPALALDGGEDGLAVAERIISEAVQWLRPGGLLAMELDENKVQDAVRAMDIFLDGSRIRSDLTGRDRFAVGVRR